MFCKLYYYIQCVSYTASVLILTVISMERYFAIIHPMLNKRIRRMCLLRVLVIIIWLCAALYGIPNLVAYDVQKVYSENFTMNFCVTTGGWRMDMEVYSIINFMMLYVLPLLLIIIMYIRISKALWKSGRNMGITASVRYSKNDHRGNTGRKKITKTVTCPNCGYIRNSKAARFPSMQGTKANSQRNTKRDEPTREGLNVYKHQGHSSIEESVMDDTTGHDSKLDNVTHPMNKNVEYTHSQLTENRSCQCTSDEELRKKNHATYRQQSGPLVTRRKVIRLLICIITTFAVCVLPHHIRLLWQYWSRSKSISFTHMLIPPTTFVFFYANSALNPFLYALLSDHFRQAFCDLLPAWCCCQRTRQSRGYSSRAGGCHVTIMSETNNASTRVISLPTTSRYSNRTHLK